MSLFGAPENVNAGATATELLPGQPNIPALTGATAQTSGFAQAGDNPHAPSAVPPSNPSATHHASGTSSSASTEFASHNPFAPSQSGGGFGGGLQSSPNVPAPGTSINPATGKPNTAGLTRAELEAIRAKGADLLDPAPQAVQATRGSTSQPEPVVSVGNEEKPLSALSGREQAARQLAGNLAASNAENLAASNAGNPTASSTGSLAAPRPTAERMVTREMPGGFGSVKPVPVPGAPGSSTTSIYEDVNEALAKVGTATFSVLPTSLKNALSASPETKTSETKTTLSPESAGSPTGRRSSVAAIFENVKQQTNTLVNEVRETVQGQPVATREGGHASSPGSPLLGNTGRRLSTALTGENGALNKVKDFLADAWVPPHLSHTHPVASGPAAPRTSLPSEEPLGARPGEFSSGVGALPGKSTETGVAVLPEEKAVTNQTASSHENQGPGASGLAAPRTSLPTEEPLGARTGEFSSGVGALPGKSTETGVAVLPEEKAVAKQAASSHENQGIRPGEVPAGAAGLSGQTTDAGPSEKDTVPSASHTEHTATSLEKAPAVLAAAPATADDIAVIPASGHQDAAANLDTLGSRPSHTDELAVVPTSQVNESYSRERSDNIPVSSGRQGSDDVPVSSTRDQYENVPASSTRDTFNDALVSSTPTTNSNAKSSSGYSGLAPPLPSTYLWKGADEGATNVTSIPGINSERTDLAQPDETESSLSASHPANDRTTSMASITAIHHGHEGQRSHHKSSPLATIPDGRAGNTGGDLTSNTSRDVAHGDGLSQGQTSTTRGTGPTTTHSLTPGNEVDGVGHPATRTLKGTGRKPGQYPAADHSAPAPKEPAFAGGIPVVQEDKSSHALPSSTRSHDTSDNVASHKHESSGAANNAAASGLGPAGTIDSASKDTNTSAPIMSLSEPKSSATHHTPSPAAAAATSPASPVHGSHHAANQSTSSHNRTSSTSSSNGGKKKAGFMSKLKGEMKVISGKIGGDEAKVQEGERLKHGL